MKPSVPERASSALRDFAARGEMIDYDGHRVFVIDDASRAKSPDARAVVFIHGFPGSAFDFGGMFDRVGEHRRVVALDLLGFGLSDKPTEMGLSLFEHADLVEVVLRRLGIRSCVLVAHDMGTTVALELCTRRRLGLLSFEIGGVLFTNGSVFIELSQLTPSQKLLRVPVVGPVFARAARFATFRAQINRISGRRLSDEALRDMFELMVASGGREVLPKLIGYVSERYRFAERWVGHLDRVDIPTSVVWGGRDPVAIPPIGERLARALPDAHFVRLEDVGHFSPLEAPAELSAEVLALAARADAAP
ncbi:MAG: alpha/beta hydrolase [Polyangiaceae bacterium]|nr:alpha/beta hydrolase [Polyangiaceae bacterium]